METVVILISIVLVLFVVIAILQRKKLKELKNNYFSIQDQYENKKRKWTADLEHWNDLYSESQNKLRDLARKGISINDDNICVFLNKLIGSQIERYYLSEKKIHNVDKESKRGVISIKIENKTLTRLVSKTNEKKLVEKFGQNYNDHLSPLIKIERDD